jgi:hypothetical protein
MVRAILIAACLAVPLVAAAVEEKKTTPQQQKMADCNKQAGEKQLKGDARKKYMSECLSGSGASPAKGQGKAGQQ